MMNKHLFLLLAGSVSVALVGCHRDPEQASVAPSLPPVKVTVAIASVGTDQAVEQVVGTVRARTSALVSARASGRIQTLQTAIGKKVKAGELLAEIDAAEIAARADQANAGLANARQELERYRKLLTQQAVTQSEFDAVEARHRIASAAVNEAGALLSYTRVLAPFDGVIARKLADVGDQAAPGRPLLELESIGGLRFESDISDGLAGRVHLGDRLPVSIDGIERPVEATVAEIAPTANALSRTVPVKFDLPEVPGLRAGQFGRVSIPVTAGINVRVPAGALLRRGQMEIVFVVREDRAQLRLVKSGKRIGDTIEILSGIEEGEAIVIGGHATLKEGQPLATE